MFQLRYSVVVLVRLDSHELQLRAGALEEDSKAFTADEIELCYHKMHSDKGNSDLSHDNLSVELDKPQPASTIERPPCLHEERAAATTDGKVNVTHHRSLVEWHDGVLALREQSRFDASESDRGREEDGQTDQDVGEWHSEEAQAEEDHLGAVLVFPCVPEMLSGLLRLRDAKCERDTNWEDESRLLSGGVHQGWEKKGLAILAGG